MGFGKHPPTLLTPKVIGDGLSGDGVSFGSPVNVEPIIESISRCRRANQLLGDVDAINPFALQIFAVIGVVLDLSIDVAHSQVLPAANIITMNAITEREMNDQS